MQSRHPVTALSRPDVDLLDGLTTAVLVDQERLGANLRSTVGTVTDANAMLRILFSRLGEPHIGGPSAFSFNVPTVRASGAITVQRGRGSKAKKATFNRLGGMCPRCEGLGTVSDVDLTALYGRDQVPGRGGTEGPRLHDGRLVRAHLCRQRLLRHEQADRRLQQTRTARRAPPRADEDQGRRHQPHLRGPHPADPEVDALQGRRHAPAARPRLRRAGGDVPDLPGVRRHPVGARGTVIEDSRCRWSARRARCPGERRSARE